MDNALEQLSQSRIKTIHVLARRGPAQAKFTPAELKELAAMEDVRVVIDPAALELDPVSAALVAEDKTVQRNMELFHHFATQAQVHTSDENTKEIHIHFCTSSVEILGNSMRGNNEIDIVRTETNHLQVDESGYLQAVPAGSFSALPADLVLRSVGYRGTPLPDVPFDDRRGTIPNRAGRVIDPATDEPVPNQYVAGWIKRGPSGVIGTNKPDAAETVNHMMADLAQKHTPTNTTASPPALLHSRNVSFISHEDWQELDRIERAKGETAGRPRVKITSIDEATALLHEQKVGIATSENQDRFIPKSGMVH